MSAIQWGSKMSSEAECRYLLTKVKRRWLGGIACLGEFLDCLAFPLQSVLWKAKSFMEKYRFEYQEVRETEISEDTSDHKLTHILYFYSKKKRSRGSSTTASTRVCRLQLSPSCQKCRFKLLLQSRHNCNLNLWVSSPGPWLRGC